MEKYCGAGQAKDSNAAVCALHAGYLRLHTHTQYLTLIVFPQQQWLHKPALTVRYITLSSLLKYSYALEGRWFRSQLVSLEFIIDIKSFRSHYGPGVDSASNRNEYQNYFLGGKGGRCVRLTTLPPSCAVVTKCGNLNFLEPSGPLRACNGIAFTVEWKKNVSYQLGRRR